MAPQGNDWDRVSLALNTIVEQGPVSRHRGHPAVEVGGSLYTSAISGVAAASAGELVLQTRAAYEQLRIALAARGYAPSNIVKLVEYVAVDALDHYHDAAGIRDEFLGASRPAIHTVIVSSLPQPGAAIEIEVVSHAEAHSSGPIGGGAVVAPDGVIHLPTILPLDDAGDVLFPGDVVRQTRAIFERANRMLAAVGAGMDHVTMTIDHPVEDARPQYRDSAEVRREFLGPVYPASAGILMPKLLHPEAMVQYEFFATREKPVAVNPGWRRYDDLTYSPAVRSGNLLFIAGQSARDPVDNEMRARGDAAGQAEFIYQKSIAIIEAAGGTASDMVRTFEYIPPRNLDAYDGVVERRQRAFPGVEIAASGIVCGSLLKRSMEIEIIGFAIIGRGAP